MLDEVSRLNCVIICGQSADLNITEDNFIASKPDVRPPNWDDLKRCRMLLRNTSDADVSLFIEMISKV
jgi:hypothetical protein